MTRIRLFLFLDGQLSIAIRSLARTSWPKSRHCFRRIALLKMSLRWSLSTGWFYTNIIGTYITLHASCSTKWFIFSHPTTSLRFIKLANSLLSAYTSTPLATIPNTLVFVESIAKPEGDDKLNWFFPNNFVKVYQIVRSGENFSISSKAL